MESLPSSLSPTSNLMMVYREFWIEVIERQEEHDDSESCGDALKPKFLIDQKLLEGEVLTTTSR